MKTLFITILILLIFAPSTLAERPFVEWALHWQRVDVRAHQQLCRVRASMGLRIRAFDYWHPELRAPKTIWIAQGKEWKHENSKYLRLAKRLGHDR